LILVPQRVTQGIGNVWGAGVNFDSATKRVAVAGDSVAKQAALLEARARQAALDSVKRLAVDSVKRALGVPITAADSAAAAARGQVPARPLPGAAPIVRDTTRARRDTTRVRRDTTRRDTTRRDTLRSDSARPRIP